MLLVFDTKASPESNRRGQRPENDDRVLSQSLTIYSVLARLLRNIPDYERRSAKLLLVSDGALELNALH